MLKTLDIENVAIIEKLSVDFSGGFAVLTGETGAGKSIVIDSINAVTGEKISKDLIRTGESFAFVSAFFDDISHAVKQMIKDKGLPTEDDGTVLLQRKISADGKSTCRINGCTVTVGMLKEIGCELINIHGQKDSQAMLDPNRHIEYLDAFGGCGDALDDYRKDFFTLRELQRKIKALETDESAKARLTDLLTYQINELESANIVPGEREELHRRKAVINNALRIRDGIKAALTALHGDGESDGATTLIGLAQREINALASAVPDAGELSEKLDDILNRAELVCDSLEKTGRTAADGSMNIEEINDRLDRLSRLSRKYGATEEEMLAFLEKSKAELNEITGSEELLETLTREFNTLAPRVVEKAAALTGKRQAAAERLSRAVENELSFLMMPNCRFTAEITKCALSSHGADNVCFNISANPGETPKPVNKIASGGELSRIMLALKTVLSGFDGVGTMIFDEIDTGVSGAVTGRIGEKLAALSKNSQVIVITHQAQLASFAKEHKYLRKEVIEGKTYTRIKTLSEEERADELARMAFGENADDGQVLSAKKLIENNRQ